MITSPGVNEFIDLKDAPNSYAGQASKVVKVNVSETAVEFGTGGGGGGSAIWGDITGTLSNQADLQAALDAKQSALVTGQVTIDFGSISSEQSITSTTVSSASISSTSIVMVSSAGVSTTDHDPDDYQWDNISGYVSNIINGVSFDIIGVAPNGSWGTYKLNYVIS